MKKIDIVLPIDEEHKVIKARGMEIMSKFPDQYIASKKETVRTMNALLTLVKFYEISTGVKTTVQIEEPKS